MRFGSVCSGIEAASVAWAPLGWRAAWLAEIEAFPCAVLAHHYPDVPNLGDMTTIRARIDAGDVEAPDLLTGGTPCQAFSVAGLRQSLADERGNLSLEFIRIADAIDRVRRAAGKQPAWIVWENVPGVLNTRDNAFGAFLGGLCGGDSAIGAPATGWPRAGVVAGPSRVVAWRVLDAQFFGVAQRRQRVFVLALGGPGSWACADALLPIGDSMQWHPAPGRKTGKAAPTIPSRSTAGGGLGTDFDCDGGLIAGTLQAGGKSAGSATQQDAEAGLLVTHSLRGEGFDASEDGTGRGTPLVPVGGAALFSIMPMNSGKDFKARQVEVAQPLMAGGPTGGNQGGDVIVQPLAFDTTQITSPANSSNPKPGDPCHSLAAGAHRPAIAFQERGRARGRNLEHQEDVAYALTAPSGGGRAQERCIAFSAKDHGGDATEDLSPTLRAGGHSGSHANAGVMPAVAFKPMMGAAAGGIGFATEQAPTLSTQDVGAVAYTTKLHNTQSNNAGKVFEERSTCLDANSPPPALLTAMQVRRLTPRECERLQGFYDDYTLIPWRTWQEASRKGASYEGLLLERGMTLRGPSREECPDGPRYKALGNSWAVPVARWIGTRIKEQLERGAA